MFIFSLYPAAFGDFAAGKTAGNGGSAIEIGVSDGIMVKAPVMFIHEYKRVITWAAADEPCRLIVIEDRPENTAGNGKIVEDLLAGGKLFFRIVIAGKETE